jgi:hypothetical protein
VVGISATHGAQIIGTETTAPSLAAESDAKAGVCHSRSEWLFFRYTPTGQNDHLGPYDVATRDMAARLIKHDEGFLKKLQDCVAGATSPRHLYALVALVFRTTFQSETR